MTLEADPVRLAQVFSNLLGNAAKFTPPGGTITIAAGREAQMMVIRVQDDGIGIEAALLPRVFDAFAQAGQASDRSQGGLGLGLSIAKSLVGLHGGQIEAHSAGHGKGSEFVVRLPAPDSKARSEAPPLAIATIGQLKPAALRVLVVDDNEDAATLLSEVLRLEGHEVQVAHDGPGALEARTSFVPDVALLDIGLPVMDGYELAEHLRARYPSSDLRLIAITGYGEQRDRIRSRAAGFDDHLVKPVDVERIRGMLAKPWKRLKSKA
jgi:CheY-like chemotaxis protein